MNNIFSNKFKNSIKFALAFALAMPMTSCNDWLNLLPNNEQVTERYWKSKEDVEHVLASGYYYMRQSVPTLINWGELRGGDFYYVGSGKPETKMQDFDLLPSHSVSNYSSLYQVIAMANSVIKYAPKAQEEDVTYYESMMKSHLCEAYFMRAWAYSILVKNFKEVPLVVEAYVNDDADFHVAKSSESAIIAQIKEDVATALATEAAKGHYEEDWQTKCRATKWALYALGADICLWNHDYDECIAYADMLIEAKDALRPVFVTETSKWYEIFYPGLSNGSIFELYWNYNTENLANNFTSKFALTGAVTTDKLNFSPYTTELLAAEEIELASYVSVNNLDIDGRWGRMYMASYSGSSLYPALWKYRGTDIIDASTVRIQNDANFVIYRMADVMLMKAEALVMKGQSSWKEAIELINAIRTRAYLFDYVNLSASDADITIASLDQVDLLEEVMHQREMEFLGEAHRWYDILRLARYDETFAPEGTIEMQEGSNYESYRTKGFGESRFKYKEIALRYIIQSNNTTSSAQLESVLQNSWAWYLPLPQSEIDCNARLKQNPYYE